MKMFQFQKPMHVVTWMALKTQPVTWRLDTPVATRPPRGSEEKLHPVTSSRPTLVAVIWGQRENMSRSRSIVKLRRGSGKDRQGMAPKAKGLKA